ncbi:L-rhamnose mutarotase [Flavimaricola marinus]|uniref:L-fucose mutarotase n=1 Tax=Flavimaricola marinus TaxID=1819565 RepID=A0A238LKT0_9RHOB|nr:L-rhamnose mutarotase [Flavimaricola marinus]SMY09995.1 L-fucose mutarotase [Flavimaricola marinus]
MKRFGAIIGLTDETRDRYIELHRESWPGVSAALGRANIRNYSIFLREPENLLFGYFEYVGDDFAADQAKLAEDPITSEWQRIVAPLQRPLTPRKDGEWWAEMPEIFHLD